MYAWDENFVLPLSHDEVVHGEALAALQDARRPLAEAREPARALRDMWAHPGKQLLFMGGELAQWDEWSSRVRSTGPCSRIRTTRACSRCMRDLNAAYRAEPALWEVDFRPEGFAWLVR